MAAESTGSFAPSSRSRARRRPQRASYDRAEIFGALDAGLLAHVGWTSDAQVFVTPTAYWRDGSALLWHGSAGSRMIAAVASGSAACVTVSSLDGLVVGRSGFAHSVNYHSVMAFGRPHVIEAVADKRAAMIQFIDRLYPGRSATLRRTTDQELAQISIVRMEIEEASLKARSGPPAVPPGDEGWPAWAGVLPIRTVFGPPSPDPASTELEIGVDLRPYAQGAAFHDVLGRTACLRS